MLTESLLAQGWGQVAVSTPGPAAPLGMASTPVRASTSVGGASFLHGEGQRPLREPSRLFQFSCQISYILKTTGPWGSRGATWRQAAWMVFGGVPCPPWETSSPSHKGGLPGHEPSFPSPPQGQVQRLLLLHF